MSPNLKAKLEAWLAKPSKSQGLCGYVNSYSCQRELEAMFVKAGLSQYFPFNDAQIDYQQEAANLVMDKNPKRMQFVIDALARANTEEKLESLESDGQEPGMYLHLLHGRNSPTEEMEEMGFEGPIFGPLKNVHIAYSSTIFICTEDWESGPMTKGDPLCFEGDLIAYRGLYYGDFAVRVSQ